MSAIVEFLLARLEEDEAYALDVESASPARGVADRALADVAAKRAIIEWHQNWPVLVETKPELEAFDMQSMAASMTRQIMWLTEREYVARFGDEPPTAPILKIMAAVYSDHPDYQEAWKP